MERTEAIFHIVGTLEDVTFQKRRMYEAPPPSNAGPSPNMCRDFLLNTCTRGNSCRFAHGSQPAPAIERIPDTTSGHVLPPAAAVRIPPTSAPTVPEQDSERANPGSSLSENQRMAMMLKGLGGPSVSTHPSITPSDGPIVSSSSSLTNEISHHLDCVSFSDSENFDAALRLKSILSSAAALPESRTLTTDEAAADDVEELVEADVMEVKGRLDRLQEDRNGAHDTTDLVGLGLEGWKERYYSMKFEQTLTEKFVANLVEEYIRGLAWVSKYYFTGCPSWKWYFPYHYAPFASDLKNLSRVNTSFTLDEPFTPFEQLLAVLPPASCEALPTCYHKFMKNADSPIIDFYPTDLVFDPNGKPLPWLWIVLLPFIDADRLVHCMKQVSHLLTPEEILRNSFGSDTMYIHCDRALGKTIVANMKDKDHFDIVMNNIDAHLDGQVSYADKYSIVTGASVSPPASCKMSPIDTCNVLSLVYNPIKVPDAVMHRQRKLLKGVVLPKPSLHGNELFRRKAKLSRLDVSQFLNTHTEVPRELHSYGSPHDSGRPYKIPRGLGAAPFVPQGHLDPRVGPIPPHHPMMPPPYFNYGPGLPPGYLPPPPPPLTGGFGYAPPPPRDMHNFVRPPPGMYRAPVYYGRGPDSGPPPPPYGAYPNSSGPPGMHPRGSMNNNYPRWH